MKKQRCFIKKQSIFRLKICIFEIILTKTRQPYFKTQQKLLITKQLDQYLQLANSL